MLELNNIKVTDVCEANKNLLREKEEAIVGLVDGEGFINLNVLTSAEEKVAFFEQFYDNEKLNTQHIIEVYQKEKYKADHIIMLLITALGLIGTGFFIAPLLVVSPIILPIIPVLLAGVSIIALTKLYLNIRLNSLETSKLQAEVFLEKISESRGSNENEVDINRANIDQTQVIQTIREATLEVTRALSEKVDTLEKNTQSFFKNTVLASKPIHDDAANQFHNREGASSLSHN